MTHWNAFNIALMILDTCKENTDECNRCPFSIDGCIVSDGNGIPEQWKAGELRDHMIEIIRRRAEK